MLFSRKQQLYTTPLGCWSIKNLSIIVDTKRRSTSFEYRLRKYYRRGYRLIFPGLPQHIVDDKINEKRIELSGKHCEMLNEIILVMDKYNYDYESNGILNIIPTDTNWIYLKNTVLPHFKITVHFSKQTKNPSIYIDNYIQIYNKLDNINNYTIDKVSDYSSINSHPSTYLNENGAYLRSDKLSAVCSILILNKNDNIEQKLLYDINNPNFDVDTMLMSYNNYTEIVKCKYQNPKQKIRSWWKEASQDFKDAYNNNVDCRRLIKCFGVLASEVIKIRDTDEYYNYVDQMVEKMKNNISLCSDKLTGIKWITKNPGRQWTSSINPIIENPRDWYGKYYDPVLTGIPFEIESSLRSLMLDKNCIWNKLNIDIFNHICLHLLKYYADKAWEYINPK